MLSEKLYNCKHFVDWLSGYCTTVLWKKPLCWICRPLYSICRRPGVAVVASFPVLKTWTSHARTLLSLANIYRFPNRVSTEICAFIRLFSSYPGASNGQSPLLLECHSQRWRINTRINCKMLIKTDSCTQNDRRKDRYCTRTNNFFIDQRFAQKSMKKSVSILILKFRPNGTKSRDVNKLGQQQWRAWCRVMFSVTVSFFFSLWPWQVLSDSSRNLGWCID